MTEADRGAVAAIELLLRGMEVTEDETEWRDMAETLVGAVTAYGLPVAVRREIEFEKQLKRDEEDWAGLYPPFPRSLAAWARGVPPEATR
jgi:hypothetical protein